MESNLTQCAAHNPLNINPVARHGAGVPAADDWEQQADLHPPPQSYHQAVHLRPATLRTAAAEKGEAQAASDSSFPSSLSSHKVGESHRHEGHGYLEAQQRLLRLVPGVAMEDAADSDCAAKLLQWISASAA